MSDREAAQAEITAKEVLFEFERIAPSSLKSKLEVAAGDSSRMKKPRKGIDQWRVRLLPKGPERTPKTFWHKERCFYEIIAGKLGWRHFHPGETAAVQFLQASRQTTCGSGRYRTAVEKIIRDFRANHPDFRIELIDDSNAYLKLVRAYNCPIEAREAANDLVNLIQGTLTRFQIISK